MKSHARIASAWERRNCGHAGPVRCGGAGSGILHNLLRCGCRYLHSQAGQLAVDPAVPPSGALPGQPEDQGPDIQTGGRAACLAAHGPRRPAAPDDVAEPAHVARFRYHAEQHHEESPSAQFGFGRRGCYRCKSASWWRRIKISAVLHISSHRDSRSHAASRVIRRNANRRHMIGDHHRGVPGEQLCWSEPWMRFSARATPQRRDFEAGSLPPPRVRGSPALGVLRRRCPTRAFGRRRAYPRPSPSGRGGAWNARRWFPRSLCRWSG